MKLAFVVSGKSPKTHPGGLGAYAYNTAKILSAMGYETYIFGFSGVGETAALHRAIGPKAAQDLMHDTAALLPNFRAAAAQINTNLMQLLRQSR